MEGSETTDVKSKFWRQDQLLCKNILNKDNTSYIFSHRYCRECILNIYINFKIYKTPKQNRRWTKIIYSYKPLDYILIKRYIHDLLGHLEFGGFTVDRWRMFSYHNRAHTHPWEACWITVSALLLTELHMTGICRLCFKFSFVIKMFKDKAYLLVLHCFASP